MGQGQEPEPEPAISGRGNICGQVAEKSDSLCEWAVMKIQSKGTAFRSGWGLVDEGVKEGLPKEVTGP